MRKEPTDGQAAGTRLSGGFTLDEVARWYRNSSPGRPMQCPTCGSAMRRVPGCCPDGEVSLLHCVRCGRGMVFGRPLGSDRG